MIDASIDPLNLNDFGNFTSLDISTVSPSSGGKNAWHQIWLAPCYSGSVDTASGLTFVGHLGEGTAQNGRGYLAAVSTKTGTAVVAIAADGRPRGCASDHLLGERCSVRLRGRRWREPHRSDAAEPGEAE